MDLLCTELSTSPTSSTENMNNAYQTVSSAPPKRPAGRTKFRETRHPVYKGVRRRGAAGRWVCEVREPNKKSRIWLGTYPTAEMAARAHDFAAMALRGRSACLNFADSAWRLQVPTSFSSPRDLARVAAKAVEAFRAEPDVETTEDGSASTTQATDDSPSLKAPTSAASLGPADGAMEHVFSYDDVDLELMQGFYYDGLMVDAGPAAWDDVEGCADVSLWSHSV